MEELRVPSDYSIKELLDFSSKLINYHSQITTQDGISKFSQLWIVGIVGNRGFSIY